MLWVQVLVCSTLVPCNEPMQVGGGASNSASPAKKQRAIAGVGVPAARGIPSSPESGLSQASLSFLAHGRHETVIRKRGPAGDTRWALPGVHTWVPGYLSTSTTRHFTRCLWCMYLINDVVLRIAACLSSTVPPLLYKQPPYFRFTPTENFLNADNEHLCIWLAPAGGEECSPQRSGIVRLLTACHSIDKSQSMSLTIPGVKTCWQARRTTKFAGSASTNKLIDR